MYDLVEHDDPCLLMVVSVGRYGVACRCQSYVDGTFGYNSFSALESGKYLITSAVGCPEGDFLLYVACGVDLKVYEEVSLLFGDCLDGKADYVFAFIGQQPHIGV